MVFLNATLLRVPVNDVCDVAMFSRRFLLVLFPQQLQQALGHVVRLLFRAVVPLQVLNCENNFVTGLTNDTGLIAIFKLRFTFFLL